MKSKQLPESLEEWLKTGTFVIGGGTSVEAKSNRSVCRAHDNTKKLERSSSAKTARIRKRILVPLFASETRRPGCLVMPKSH